jgi:hypothetical protein
LRSVGANKNLCNHLLGEDHSHGHRMIVGIMIMFLGVVVAKSGSPILILHCITETIGFGLHALGAVPFIEYANKKRDGKVTK